MTVPSRPTKILTLCMVHSTTHILLGMKKRGLGVGRWNGFGGKVQTGETIAAAAGRELTEEAGIVPTALRQRGVLRFVFDHAPECLEVHVFQVAHFQGEPVETEEMRPQWFALSAIPYDAMWPDDRYWLPLLLEGKSFQGDVHFRDYDVMLRHNIIEVPAADV
jgi:8-oxo-dGTP diphosphatase/2-hydroxy-dATP diphosphatase